MISNYFDLFFLCSRFITTINQETKKNQIKLVWNHFDLKFILNYTIYESVGYMEVNIR